MSENNIKPVFDEYFSSFINAFELKGDSTYQSNTSLPSYENEYVSDYLHCTYETNKPPMKKSLSWSSTDPSIAFERDSYLKPYACSDYKKYLFQRPRSITLPTKPSSRFLTVDRPVNIGNYHSSSSFGSSDSLSCPSNLMPIEETVNSDYKRDDYSNASSQEEINLVIYDNESDMDDMYLDTPCRARSNTAPPNISITAENGHSKYLLDVLSEEPVFNGSNLDYCANLKNNNNNSAVIETKKTDKNLEKPIPMLKNYCWLKQ